MAHLRPLAVSELQMTKKFGKVYGYVCRYELTFTKNYCLSDYRTFLGNEPVLTVNDPELIKLILVKDFNIFQNRRSFKTNHEVLEKTVLYSRSEEWKRLRSLASAVFTGAKLKGITPLIMKCVDEVIKVMNGSVKSGKDIDLKHLFGSFSMDVIARCAFATRIDAYEDPNNSFLQNAKRITRPTFFKISAVLLLPKYLLELFNIGSMFDETANRFLFRLSQDLLDKRRNNNEFHNDLLQILIDTEVDKNGSIVRPHRVKSQNEHKGQYNKNLHSISLTAIFTSGSGFKNNLTSKRHKIISTFQKCFISENLGSMKKLLISSHFNFSNCFMLSIKINLLLKFAKIKSDGGKD